MSSSVASDHSTAAAATATAPMTGLDVSSSDAPPCSSAASASTSIVAPRRASQKIWVGSVPVGGDAPISVQSMLVNDTRDVETSVSEIQRLAEAGCEIIRLAVPDKEAAEALKAIVPRSPIPVVADIHFDYRLALQAADNGVHAIRINPGNIGPKEFVKAVAQKCQERQLPIRVGVNSGSVEKPIKEKYPHDRVTQLVESALLNIRLLEDEGFDQIKVSVKASDPMEAVAAYRRLATQIPYALHLGVTEAGTLKRGLIKSAFALGMLLAEGIGDTIRISLTADSVEEVFAGHELLRSLGLRKQGANLISCPSCGRCEVDLHKLANEVETLIAKMETPLNVAVMGCFVNGPGEAGHADIGIAGGKGQYYIFKGEERILKVPEDQALDVFKTELAKTEAEYHLSDVPARHATEPDPRPHPA
ncbi:MAG: flavodoxin-dependent (E)-4-hydroxy-3-methylbut-2-enyl-diphosphate synthase [Candidatus Melainabacteria bacterium]|nr:flavodoxin-dependent (E)-4-hydroxy-3-methylbut-2-enyl-diphosphate synthase [Candidatus Melainabacteria bacterium]